MATMADKSCLLDTNVLLAATLPNRSLFRQAHHILVDWPREGWELFTSGQILREYLVVATRPIEGNGLGMDPRQAIENIEALASRMSFLAEDHRVAAGLRGLVRTFDIRGKQIHDASLTATAIGHGVTTVVTANPADFHRFGNLLSLVDLASVPV